MICSNMIAFGLGRKKQTNWLKFTAEEAGSTIAMTKGASAPSVSLETSSNGKTWVDFIAGTTEITLSNVGDYVYFRAGKSGNSTFASGTSEANCNIFSISG